MNRGNLPLKYNTVVNIALQESKDYVNETIMKLSNGEEITKEFNEIIKKNLDQLNSEANDKINLLSHKISVSMKQMEKSIKEQQLMKEYQEKMNTQVLELKNQLNIIAEKSKEDIKLTSKNILENVKKDITQLSNDTQQDLLKQSQETENIMRHLLKEHQNTELNFKQFVADKIDHIDKMEMKISSMKSEIELAKNELRKMSDAYSAVISQFSDIYKLFNKPKKRTLFSRNSSTSTSTSGSTSTSFDLLPSAPIKEEFIDSIDDSIDDIDLPSYNDIINEKGKEKI